MNIGIIGFGLIGKKRAKNLGKGKLIAYSDLHPNEDQEKLLNGVKYYSDWNELVSRDDIDIIIISTPNNLCCQIAEACIEKSRNFLVEKPAGLNFKEVSKINTLARKKNIKAHVGFNHRFHPSLIKAKEIIDNGIIGELMFIRSRYGHGGRIGYEKEWRSKPNISGGGEILDQGCHLIDLSRWLFKSEFSRCISTAKTYFWNMSVEDNGFIILETEKNQTSFMHVSCTEWKNTFSMEIYGKIGKIDINGLGGSYGTEQLILYKMLPEMGPPLEQKWVYEEEDKSWLREIEDFYYCVENDNRPSVTLDDAEKALKIIDKIYRDNGYDYST